MRKILTSVCGCLKRCVPPTFAHAPQLSSYSTSVAARTSWAEQAILYIHWPYCKKKCTYCNFNKYVSDTVDHSRMRKCLVKETENLLDLSTVKTIKSIFFGGGTPSLAEPATIEAIVKAVSSKVHLSADFEVTLEANPTSTEASKLRDFKSAGINRISLGVQALNDEDLQVLGREHSVSEALRCLDLCKTLFPGRTSVDVMFARPRQGIKEWELELDRILELCDDHLSLYQLTLEKGTTLFQQVMNRELHLPSPDAVADMYEMVVNKAEESGLRRYEVSNFSRNQESESVHNKGYWQSSQYIGVGPGAHGRFVVGESGELCDRQARVQAPVPDTWMELVEKQGHGTIKSQTQSQTHILHEVLMLGLRTADGISQANWQIFCDPSLEEVFGEAYMVKMLQDEGYLHLDNECLKATPQGLNVADGLTKELISVLNVQFGEDS